MNRGQVEHFLNNYGNMSDEALAHLLVTRSGQLSDEAEHALRQILSKRNPTMLRSAAEAVARDLNAQAQQATRVAHVHETSATVAQWTLRGIGVLICLIGLFEMLNGVRNGVFGMALGLVWLITVEIRRLLRWVLREMFNMR